MKRILILILLLSLNFDIKSQNEEKKPLLKGIESGFGSGIYIKNNRIYPIGYASLGAFYYQRTGWNKEYKSCQLYSRNIKIPFYLGYSAELLNTGFKQNVIFSTGIRFYFNVHRVSYSGPNGGGYMTLGKTIHFGALFEKSIKNYQSYDYGVNIKYYGEMGLFNIEYIFELKKADDSTKRNMYHKLGLNYQIYFRKKKK